MINYRRLIYICLIIFLLVLLQTSFLPNLSKTRPDFVLLFIVMLGLYNGLEEGILSGLIAGIMLGFFSSGYTGILCAGYGIAGFLSGLVRERVYSDYFIVPVCLSVVMTLLTEFLVFFSGMALGIVKGFDSIREHMMILIVINAIFAIPIGYLVRSRFIASKKIIE